MAAKRVEWAKPTAGSEPRSDAEREGGGEWEWERKGRAIDEVF